MSDDERRQAYYWDQIENYKNDIDETLLIITQKKEEIAELFAQAKVLLELLENFTKIRNSELKHQIKSRITGNSKQE